MRGRYWIVRGLDTACRVVDDVAYRPAVVRPVGVLGRIPNPVGVGHDLLQGERGGLRRGSGGQRRQRQEETDCVIAYLRGRADLSFGALLEPRDVFYKRLGMIAITIAGTNPIFTSG